MVRADRPTRAKRGAAAAPGAAVDRKNIDDLRMMLLIRRFEDAAAEGYARARIGGFLHLYNGQEAIAAGAIGVLAEEDYVVTHYRDHGHALARGSDPRRVMAELYGKATGVSSGKGGSMHLFDAERNFMGGYAIVGGHLPIACGLGLALQYRQTPGAVLCFFGDGSVNEGEWHESMNLAAVWKLPVIFFCENNGYAMGTEISRTSAVTDIYKRASAYDIPAEKVDGMDLWAVRTATEKALAHVRGGAGPYMIEAVTYRFRGHSMADPELYRSKDEVAGQRSSRDPIDRVRTRLEEAGLLDAVAFDAMREDVERDIGIAVQYAEDSPDPKPEALYDDVYRGLAGTGTTGTHTHDGDEHGDHHHG